jgi:hypothetical protein
MQNGGGFGGPAGVEFLHLTSKFWSTRPYGGPTGDALMAQLNLKNCEQKDNRAYPPSCGLMGC